MSSCGKNRALFLAAVLLACATLLPAQDDPKARIKSIREWAKQGSVGIPQIAPLISDPDAGVRLEAVKAIVQIDTPASVDPLVKACTDNDPDIQIRAVDGLVNAYLPGYIDTGISAPFKKMGTLVKSKFTDTNDQVIDAYVTVRPEVIEALGKLARGGGKMEVRAHAARGLGILRGRAAVPDLLAAIGSNDADVNYEALIALEKIRDKSAGPAIAYRIKDPSEKVQMAAIEATGLLENHAAVNQVRDALDRSKSSKVKRTALTALAMMPDAATRPVFLYHREDKDEALRAAALEGLGRMHDPADKGPVEKSWNDEKKPAGRMAAAFALVAMGQQDMGEFAPLRYLVNQLNSAAYRGVAVSYLIELVRDPGVRQAVYPAFQQTPTRDEKTGLAQVLGASGDGGSIPYLETLSKDSDPEVAKEALRALQNLRSHL